MFHSQINGIPNLDFHKASTYPINFVYQKPKLQQILIHTQAREKRGSGKEGLGQRTTCQLQIRSNSLPVPLFLASLWLQDERRVAWAEKLGDREASYSSLYLHTAPRNVCSRGARARLTCRPRDSVFAVTIWLESLDSWATGSWVINFAFQIRLYILKNEPNFYSV